MARSKENGNSRNYYRRSGSTKEGQIVQSKEQWSSKSSRRNEVGKSENAKE